MDEKELLRKLTLHLREHTQDYAEQISISIQDGLLSQLPLKFYDLLNKEFDTIFLKPGTVLRIYDDTFLHEHREYIVLDNHPKDLGESVNFEDRIQCPNPYCLSQGQIEVITDDKIDSFFCPVCFCNWKIRITELKENKEDT